MYVKSYIYNTFSVHWYLVNIMQMLRLNMNFILCLKTLSSVCPEIHDIHLNCHKTQTQAPLTF